MLDFSKRLMMELPLPGSRMAFETFASDTNVSNFSFAAIYFYTKYPELYLQVKILSTGLKYK